MGSGCPTEFYHGTSLEAILAIQQAGFRVDLSGTNAGAALGPGVYITTTLEKALNYAHGLPNNRNPARGAVLVLEVDIGRCYAVRFNNVAECTGWQQRGYDSAWAAEGVIGEREENCVRDPARIRITNVVLGHTGQARSLGYVVRNGRLEKVHVAQGPRLSPAQLQPAVERGDEATVRAWLDGGGRPTVTFQVGPASGIPILELAARHGHERVVDLLLRRGAEVNQLDGQGGTALMAASLEGHVGVIETLVRCGANLNHQHSNGGTALMLAAATNHPDVVRRLLVAGSDMEARDVENKTAQHYANSFRHVACADLLQASAQLKPAIERGDEAAVRMLLDSGAPVDLSVRAGPASGISILAIAAGHGHERVVDLLLQRGATVNKQDDQGGTALMWAANSNEPSIVRRLLWAGANREKRTVQGKTALQYAMDGGYRGCVDALLT